MSNKNQVYLQLIEAERSLIELQHQQKLKKELLSFVDNLILEEDHTTNLIEEQVESFRKEKWDLTSQLRELQQRIAYAKDFVEIKRKEYDRCF